jgi:hypothetical protein
VISNASFGAICGFHISVKSPEKHTDDNDQRDDTPGQFQTKVIRSVRRRAARFAPVAHYRPDRQTGDQHKEEDTEVDEEHE